MNSYIYTQLGRTDEFGADYNDTFGVDTAILACLRSSGLSAPSCVPSVASGIAERARAAP